MLLPKRLTRQDLKRKYAHIFPGLIVSSPWLRLNRRPSPSAIKEICYIPRKYNSAFQMMGGYEISPLRLRLGYKFSALLKRRLYSSVLRAVTCIDGSYYRAKISDCGATTCKYSRDYLPPPSPLSANLGVKWVSLATYYNKVS